MRSIPEIAAVALLIALPVVALPMPTATAIASPAAHTPSGGLGPGEDQNQPHSAHSANGVQAAEKALDQILENRLKSICRGC